MFIEILKVTTFRVQTDKISKYSSHYRREQTEAKYLTPGITIQKLDDMYKQEEADPVSLMNIFYTKFNLKIKELQKTPAMFAIPSK